jgi:hypothetical protein
LRSFARQVNGSGFSLDALDALLAFFQRNPISYSLQSHKHLLAVFEALESLRRLASVSRNHPDHLDVARARLQSRAQDVTAWVESGIPTAFLLVAGDVGDGEEMLKCVANALAACLAVGGECETTFLKEPRTMTAMLKLWSSCLDPPSGKLVGALQEQGTSIIVAALMMIIRTQEGQRSFTDYLSNHPDELQKFCEATSSRVSQIPNLSQPDGMDFDVPKAQRTLYMDIWQTTKELSKHPFVHKALCDADTLTSWSGTLVRISSGYPPLELFQVASWLITRSLEVGGNPTQNLTCVLNSRYLGVVLHAASRCDPNAQMTEILTRYFVSSLEAYTAYPRIILQLSGAVEFLMPEQRDSVTSLPRLGQYWAYLFAGIIKREKERALFEGGVPFLCDNSIDVRLPG